MKSDKLQEQAILKTAIVGAVVFLATGFLAMLLFAALLFFTEIGETLTPLFATLSVAIGIFFSAYFIARKTAKKGFLIGAIAGITVFVLITIISFILDDGTVTSNTLFHLVIFILSGLIGGITGVNKPKKKYL